MSDCMTDFIKANFSCSRFLFKEKIRYDEIDCDRKAAEIPTPSELAYAIADLLTEISSFQEYSPKISNLLILDYNILNCKTIVC